MHKNFKDLTGKCFGRLTVLAIDYYVAKYRKYYYICSCACGKELTVSAPNLRSGNTISCGCFRKEINSKKQRKNPGEATFNAVFITYKNTAKRNKRVFDLTKEQFKTITSQKCSYCKRPPKTEQQNIYGNGSYIYNGIDRVDNNLGYVLTNIVPCCTICNRAKGNLTLGEFKNWINDLKENN